MSAQPAECNRLHTRLLKCALEVEDARAYWLQAAIYPDATAVDAFDGYWFGARSLARIKVLLANFRARFDAFSPSLEVLHRWVDMSPDTRRLVCHWHLQLSDPLYRAFTGDYLVERRDGSRPEVTRDLIVGWVSDQGAERWTMATRIQFASKLLSAAHGARLVNGIRDPRPLALPRVPDEALEYLMYLLRGVRFEGTLLDNPYARSVGLDRTFLEERLQSLPAIRFSRQGDLIDFGWRHSDLADWAEGHATVGGKR